MRTIAPAAALAALLAGCGSLGSQNEPINQAIAGNASEAFAAGRQEPSQPDDVLVGLAFSGGGTRAAAFSYGVLTELDRTRIPSRSRSGSLLDHVEFVSGVSGGSVIAAYYGLKKRAALADFRERFLLRDAEESLTVDFNPITLAKAFNGGVNDSSQLSGWLNENLFGNATFNDFRKTPGPRVWINASDIYNRTPFVFGVSAFVALCSDLGNYPIADAVAASAAVPVVFSPVVIKTYPRQCTDRTPEWIERARTKPNTPPMLKAFADALARYKDGSMSYVKLLDGGLVDNFGLSGFTITLLSAEQPYGPFTPQQAVRLKRAIYVVADAGRGPAGDWVNSVDGPGGMDLVMAASDTAVDANVRTSFVAFERMMSEWQGRLVRWRCGLSADQRSRLGAPANWNCSDVKLLVTRVAFDQLAPERAAMLSAVPSRFKLEPQQVDLLIAAGQDALRGNPVFRTFLAGVGARQPLDPRPPSAEPRVAHAASSQFTRPRAAAVRAGSVQIAPVQAAPAEAERAAEDTPAPRSYVGPGPRGTTGTAPR